jgi:rhamnosyltransferase
MTTTKVAKSDESVAYCHDVAAVLVTYNPDRAVLRESLRAVGDQVGDLFVIDNASTSFPLDLLEELKGECVARLHFIPQTENRGVGAGHNRGIEAARAFGSRFVLLLDQDSQVASDMVGHLRSNYARLLERGLRVAALGPRYRDSDSGLLSKFVRVGLLGFDLIGCGSEDQAVAADFLVSSGLLLPLTVLDAVGSMNEELFIDHVDTEWCFRAKSHGFRLFGVCAAIMTHELGERRKEVWIFRKRVIPFHKPFRYYYIYRNSILLYRSGHMPLKWKLVDFLRSLKMAVFFGIFAPNRLDILKMMCLGVMDGLNRVSGRRDHF